MTWSNVLATLPDAKSIAWDGCHTIYVLLDDEQTEQMRQWGYGDGVVSELRLASEFATRGDMNAVLREWWDDSCGLRFINAVRTVPGDPNGGFRTLIGQFECE